MCSGSYDKDGLDSLTYLYKNDPHGTLIANERCGFGFITHTFANYFYDKVFYGQELIPPVIIVNEKKI
jgi:hypothetical protein